jgi:RHS repeat-associated protein
MYGVMTDSNGLYYMRARFYSPEMRRFVNQDILLGFVEDGQSLNRYAYVIINWGQSQINFSAPNYFVIW